MASGAIPEGFATGETPVSSYTDAVKSSFAQYNDLALVVITRTSGENSDLPTTMKNTAGAYAETDHYLELDRNEQEMLKLACENFENVVLLINAGTPIELGFLDATDDNDESALSYDFASEVKGAIQIGLPGEVGMSALGKILNGEVNPSGRTVDTYVRDFTKIPALENYSVKGENNLDSYTLNGTAQDQWFIDYEEGIYVGYKYFETRGETDGEEWYDNNVVYPLGYGLSYTTFTKEVKETNITDNASWTTGKEELSVTVTVSNTGELAGKEVVQLYVKQPYVAGGVEKASEVLVAFGKTEEIPAGESKDVTLTFTPYDFASYDHKTDKAYVLDAGSYEFRIASNAHKVDDTITTTLGSKVVISEDTTTGYEVKNRFDDADDELGSQLSRNDWDGTKPEMRTASEKAATQAFITDLQTNKDSGNPLTADSDVVKEAAENRVPAKAKKEEGLMLYELKGLPADHALWDQIMTRITASSLWDTLSQGAFKTPSISYIGKPETIETDGPAGFTKFMGSGEIVSDTCFYACEPVLAATWNVELAEKMGNAIGNEGIIGYTTAETPYSGWYAPGVNIHRTPFGGRCPEYYSEDAMLSGKMASGVIRGAATKGVYTFVKHFAVNDQETHRGGVCTWLNEQALREIYLKPFELAVKEGGSTAMMSSFNRIGKMWTGGDYRLMTEVLRNEWGFNGTVVCDFASNQPHMDMEQMVYAGGDTWLDTITPKNWFDKDNSVDVYVMQEGVKHVLYTIVNSNAMNGLGEGVIYQTYPAYWRIILLIVSIVIAVGLAVWCTLMIIRTIKKSKRQ
ncbi:MAG: fibronectin type III-like domain-contianing protein [Clostridia bacterium]|nr:fibronectin type III-like domain-contianing protein [Clostridia bacterium]